MGNLESKYDLKGVFNLLAINEDDLDVIQLIATAAGALKTAGYVWDADTLSWVKAQQGATAEDINSALGDSVAETRLAYDSGGNVEYIGDNDTLDAATSDIDWVITKLTYTSGQVTKVQVAEGAWDNKETYF